MGLRRRTTRHVTSFRRRLLATAIGWGAAVVLVLPLGILVGLFAVLLGATGSEVTGNGPIGVIVVVFGVHLPAGVLAAVTMPRSWQRLVGQTTTVRRALRVTVPTMLAVGVLEVIKAALPAVGYVVLTFVQAAIVLLPIALRGLPAADATA